VLVREVSLPVGADGAAILDAVVGRCPRFRVTG